MNKNIVIQKLENVGLSELESRVYIATLENGTSAASTIASSAKMNRVSCYDILKKLIKRGLVSTSTIRDTKHFTAMDPKLFAEDREKKAEDLKKTIPFLESLMKSSESHPTVRYFEGLKAVKKAYKESLEAKGEILNYANSHNIRDHWPEYDEEYVEKRKEKNIFLRGIALQDEEGKIVKSEDKDYLRETRLISADTFSMENEINIFDDKVIIASYEPRPFAIIIESSAVAETQKHIFEVLWNLVKK